MGRIMPRHLLGRSEACASDLSVIEAARSTNVLLSCRHAKSLLSIIRILAAVLLLTKTGWLFAAEATNSTARSAEVTNSTSRSEYKAFQIISDRNIFNPNRSPRSARNGRESAKPVKTESFSLVGTMSYDKGRFAFFDGSSSQFRKVLKCSDTIAGYKITEIGANRVKLKGTNQEIELNIGAQMKKQDEGDWSLAGRAAKTTNSITTAVSPETAEAGSSSGDDDEILKKLMQKREQELNK